MLVICRKSEVRDFFDANVEALAQEEAIRVEYCFIDNRDYGKYTSARFCNRQTNADYIYPCESNSWGYKSEGLTDRCSITTN
jgi:hypothetical protein